MVAVIALVCFALVAGLIALAVIILPWWGAVIAIIGGLGLAVVAVRLLSARLISYVLTMPFRMKGRTLKDAGLTVHAVARAEPPDRFRPTDDVAVPLVWTTIDCTISPRPSSGIFTFWDSGDLMLVDYNDVVCVRNDPDSDGAVGGPSPWEELLVKDDGSSELVTGKLAGPARLRLSFGLPPDFPNRVKLQYYFTSFGDIDLSPALIHPTNARSSVSP
ncbi:MAG: hypothetical protein AAGI46_06490 [Planctomycetota bacterium]